jgi:UDP-N-acetylglucosamine 2-epimerase (non-hydrolysing)
MNMKMILVAGARPNFMKVAPLVRTIERFNYLVTRDSQHVTCNSELATRNPQLDYLLVHTGQHYDMAMSEAFFRELELPKPDINLEVGSSSHAVQTAEIMKRFEPVLMKEQPDVVILVGDVNSTMACALVASKIEYPLPPQSSVLNANGRRKPLIAHVEAGLRSFDRTMPEEINRLVTDAIADLLFTPSDDADENLLREGVPKEKIKRVGNIMIDTLVSNLGAARSRKILEASGVDRKQYAFVTLHRPSNVDDRDSLSGIIESLTSLCGKIPVVFPVHPRTRKRLEDFGLWSEAERLKDLKLLDPIGYLDTICFEENSRFVLTDSGGIQEETTFLGIPCLTLRPNTERPVTLTQGTNKLTSLGALEGDFDHILNGYRPSGKIPDLWDGHTADRIIQILVSSKT